MGESWAAIVLQRTDHCICGRGNRAGQIVVDSVGQAARGHTCDGAAGRRAVINLTNEIVAAGSEHPEHIGMAAATRAIASHQGAREIVAGARDQTVIAQAATFGAYGAVRDYRAIAKHDRSGVVVDAATSVKGSVTGESAVLRSDRAVIGNTSAVAAANIGRDGAIA